MVLWHQIIFRLQGHPQIIAVELLKPNFYIVGVSLFVLETILRKCYKKMKKRWRKSLLEEFLNPRRFNTSRIQKLIIRGKNLIEFRLCLFERTIFVGQMFYPFFVVWLQKGGEIFSR